jgi:NAD+ kinase
MKTIGILARSGLKEAGAAVAELVGWLSKEGVRVCLEEHTARLGPPPPPETCTVESGSEVVAKADVLVVLGGDGTLLLAAHLLSGRPVPILGVNFGSLGFLTEISLPELRPTLEGVLKGGYQYDERRMLHASVLCEGSPKVSHEVLNDVVLSKGAALSRIIELDVFIDTVFVSAFRADGLIVSSPTGSTAYNLAAGGPILHPSLPAVVVTPISPHMLTNRPIVVSDASTIEIRLRPVRDMEVHVTFDGQTGVALAQQDTVQVTRSEKTLRLVRAPARDYFEVLRTKLKWGESTTRRP